VRAPFDAAGVATFEREREAMDALVQLADHSALLARPVRAHVSIPRAGSTRFLNEAESLERLAQAGLNVVEHELCGSRDDAVRAAAALGPEVVMKACSPDVPHKSDHGLVALSPFDPAAEFERQAGVVRKLGGRFDGVIVARKARRGKELALGARLDPHFGPVVLVGDGGVYLEALRDFRLLLPPFGEQEVLEKLNELRVAPLLREQRGEPARDTAAFATMAVRLGEALLRWNGAVASVDVNPVILFETGAGAVAVDGLVECRL
jgi:acyl-CoA synthetase (NDP forming)